MDSFTSEQAARRQLSDPGAASAGRPPLRERFDRELRARVTARVVMVLARRTPYLETEMLGHSRNYLFRPPPPAPAAI